MAGIPDIQDRSVYPDMTHWFNPLLLSKLLLRVIVSDVFGQYADRRLMVAALDTVTPQQHLDRAKEARVDPDKNGATWIDFVADMGDGFDATYAVALLLAKDKLTLDGDELPRGSTLILGGDEVYPTATAEAYRNQLGAPYGFARPDHDRGSNDGTAVYAVPGNHDWYDGLVHFLAFFCREKSWHMGAWRSRQRRSYFALQLTADWWLWSIDIQLADNMDQPQADYFKLIAEQMPERSKIILCGAEPGWLYTEKNKKSFEIVDYAVGIATNAKRDLSVPILLSGDTHHYSRYASDAGTQFITSGGGGGFLHPTHQLADDIAIRWLNKENTHLSLKMDPTTNKPGKVAACYPSREISKKLLWRNLWFPATNWDFAILMGAVYWIAALVITLRHEPDTYFFIFGIFALVMTKYVQYQEKSHRPIIYVSGITQGLAHAGAVILLTKTAAAWNAGYFAGGHWYDGWLWLGALLVEVGIPGGIIGSFIFGLNLLITCRWFKLNDNDAFSALRLDSFRNFLRIKIERDQVTIYPIGLDQVPRRHEWKLNPRASKGNSAEPMFLPERKLTPHLIEKPIVVRG